jgi:integrase
VARVLNRLSQTFVAKHTTPGLYGDGNGLYLQIAPGTAEDDAEYVTKSWIFRYAVGTGKEKRDRKMGLGAYPLVSLALAREIAIECSLKRLKGIDPLEEREAEKRQKAAADVKTIIFEKAAEKYIAAHEAGWKNAKHRQQWTNTLKTYAYPVIGQLTVRDIDTELVMQVLNPIWTTKPETAGRVRGRIESILDWCKVQGFREGENPARWDGHLDKLLPKRGKVRKVKPHPALPYKRMAEFMADLRNRTGVSAKALEFTILTASRTTEVIEAQWPEINKDDKIWTVPAERMKGDRDHEVMLSDAAIAVLEHQWKIRCSEWVFPGGHEGEPLSNAAMSELVKQMNTERKTAGLPRWIDPKQGGRAITVHGFRSSFKDWASECTTFRDAVSEVALAHIEGDKVRAAYERSTFDEWRRDLMAVWADYCDGKAGDDKVIRPQFGGRA